MKTFLNFIWSVINTHGTARAAAALARAGRYEEAKALMNK